jgi:outer membrane immunogenic protein
MHRTLAAFAALALVSGQALAADMVVKAPPPLAPTVARWDGFYVGGSFGGVWNHPTNWTFPFAPTLIATIPSGNSWAAGYVAGYNIQIRNFVLGFETNQLFTNLRNIGVCPNGNICVQETKALQLYGGRAGYAWDNWLFTVAGGYARTSIASPVYLVANGAFSDGGQSWNPGWYAGLGVDYQLTPYVNVGIQYVHVQANSVSQLSPPILRDDRVVSDKEDLILARLTFNLVPLRDIFGWRN